LSGETTACEIVVCVRVCVCRSNSSYWWTKVTLS